MHNSTQPTQQLSVTRTNSEVISNDGDVDLNWHFRKLGWKLPLCQFPKLRFVSWLSLFSSEAVFHVQGCKSKNFSNFYSLQQMLNKFEIVEDELEEDRKKA